MVFSSQAHAHKFSGERDRHPVRLPRYRVATPAPSRWVIAVSPDVVWRERLDLGRRAQALERVQRRPGMIVPPLPLRLSG
jgi:hypothetical protein